MINSEFETRLKRLENANRILKLILFFISATGGGFLLLGQQAPSSTTSKTIESEKFLLKDSKGIIRGGFQTEGDGSVMFYIGDSPANSNVRLGSSLAMGSSLLLREEKGEISSSISTSPIEGTSILMGDEQGKPKLSINYSKGSKMGAHAGLTIYGANNESISLTNNLFGSSLDFNESGDFVGKTRISLGYSRVDKSAKLDLNRKPFKNEETPPTRARISVEDDGSPNITLFDDGIPFNVEVSPDGQITKIPYNPTKNKEIALYEPIARLILGCSSLVNKIGSVENRSPAPIVLFDKAGKVIYAAPQ